MALPRFVLGLLAVSFAVIGTVFTVAPVTCAAFLDIHLTTPTARTDFRATYGGLDWGLAVFLAACLRDMRSVRAGLLAAASALAGAGVTRSAALCLDGPAAPLLYVLLASETLGAGIAFVAWCLALRAGN